MLGGIHTHKALLCVEYYEISTKFIHDLRLAHTKPEEVFRILPKYTINTNKEANNRPIDAEYFHQYVGLFDQEENVKYKYFNLHTLDVTLDEEFKAIGVDEFFKDLDFLKLLSNFTPEPDENISKFVFSNCNYFIVELVYDVSYDREGGYDCETSYDIIGYLDNNLNTVYFNGKDTKAESN